MLIELIQTKFIQIILKINLFNNMNLREFFKLFKIKMKLFKFRLDRNGNIWCIFLCWFLDIFIFFFMCLCMVIINFMIRLLVIKKWKKNILVKIFMTTFIYVFFMHFIFYIYGLQQIKLVKDFLWRLQQVHSLNIIIHLERLRFHLLLLCLF